MHFQTDRQRVLNQLHPQRQVAKRVFQPTSTVSAPAEHATYDAQVPRVYEDTHHHAYEADAYVPFTPETHVADLVDYTPQMEAPLEDWSNQSIDGYAYRLGHDVLAEIDTAVEEVRQQPLTMPSDVDVLDSETTGTESELPSTLSAGQDLYSVEPFEHESTVAMQEYGMADDMPEAVTEDSMPFSDAGLDGLADAMTEPGSPLEQTIDDYLMQQGVVLDPFMQQAEPYAHYGPLDPLGSPFGQALDDGFGPQDPFPPGM